MSFDYGARPVKLPSFKITSKKPSASATTEPPAFVNSGHRATGPDHSTPGMTTGRDEPAPQTVTGRNEIPRQAVNQPRKEKHQVAHVSRSRSVRENPNSDVQEQHHHHPSTEQTNTHISKSTPFSNSDALIPGALYHHQPVPESVTQAAAEPSSNGDVNERYVSSFLRKMDLLDLRQNPVIVDTVDHNKPVAQGLDSHSNSQFKHRAKSEPARSRKVNQRKQVDCSPEAGKTPRDKKSPRASSEHRYQPTTDPSKKSDMKPSNDQQVLPTAAGELHCADKNQAVNKTTNRHSHKRKSKNKKTKGKNTEPPQSVNEEQLYHKTVFSNNKDTEEAQEQPSQQSHRPSQEPCQPPQQAYQSSQEPCQPPQQAYQSSQEPCQPPEQAYQSSQQPYHSSQQPRQSAQQPYHSSQQPRQSAQQPYHSSQQPRQSSQQPYHSSQQPRQSSQQTTCGFRFGKRKKESSKLDDLPHMSENPTYCSVSEEKTFKNQQCGDEVWTTNKYPKELDDSEPPPCRRQYRASQRSQDDNIETTSATELSRCDSEPKLHRRRSCNLCLRKRVTATKRDGCGGGNFFQSFADAVGGQLSSIACANQRLYRFPGIQGLYTPDVDLNSMYQLYDRDEECEDESEHTEQLNSPHNERSPEDESEDEVERLSKTDTDRQRSESPMSDRETQHESASDADHEGSPMSQKGSVIIESSISLTSRGSEGRSSRRGTLLSDVAESDSTTKRRGSGKRMSVTSHIRASPKSGQESKRSSVQDDASSKSFVQSSKSGQESKRSSVPENASSKSFSQSVKGGSSKSRKSSATSGSRKGRESPEKKRSRSKTPSAASSRVRDKGSPKSSRASDRATPTARKTQQGSSRVGKMQQRVSPSQNGPSRDHSPEADSELSAEDSNVTQHTAASKRLKTRSQTSREVYDSEDGRVHVEMGQTVSEGKSSSDSVTSVKSHVSSRFSKINAQKDRSRTSERSLAGSSSKGHSKKSSGPSSSVRSKQSSGILRAGRKTPQSRQETPQEQLQSEIANVVTPPEGTASTPRSSRSPPGESVLSFAPSERQKAQESIYSLEKRSISRSDRTRSPESAKSLARSDRIEPPENIHSFFIPQEIVPPESIRSSGRSEGTLPPESVRSYPVSGGILPQENIRSYVTTEGTLPPESIRSYVTSEGILPPESIRSLGRSEGILPPESIRSSGRSEGILPPESLRSSGRSEGILPPESLRSSGRSEGILPPESLRLSGRSEGILLPESVSSSMRSVRMEIPENVQSSAKPDRQYTESMTSRTKEDRSPPHGSQVSVAASNASSKRSKAESRKSYWSGEGKQSIIISDGSYIIDTIQTIVVSEEGSSSESSVEDPPNMVMELPGRSWDKVALERQPDIEQGREDMVLTPTYPAPTERLEETLSCRDSMEASERTRESCRERTRSPCLGKEGSELLVRRSDRGSKESCRPSVLTPGTEIMASHTTSERLQEAPTSRQATASPDRTHDSFLERTSTPSKIGSQRLSVDLEQAEMSTRRSDTGSKQSRHSVEIIPATETVSRTSGEIFPLTPVYGRESMSEVRKSSHLSDVQIMSTRESMSDGRKSSYLSDVQTMATRESLSDGRKSSHLSDVQTMSKRESMSDVRKSSRLSDGQIMSAPESMSDGWKSSRLSDGQIRAAQESMSDGRRSSRLSDGQIRSAQESMSDGRRSSRLSDGQTTVGETHTLSTSDRQQTPDGRTFYSTSELQSVNADRSSADTSQTLRTSAKNSGRQSADLSTPKRASEVYTESRRSTPPRSEQHHSCLDDQRRDENPVLERGSTDMDVCRRALSERNEVGRWEKGDTGIRGVRECCCTEGRVHQVKIIMRNDSSDDGRASCSCIQVCSSMRSRADCLMMRAMDCKRECFSSEHTGSGGHCKNREKSDGCCRCSDRAHRSRDVCQEIHRRDKAWCSPGSSFGQRCPCESATKADPTGAGSLSSRERRSQEQSPYPASPKRRQTPLYDHSTPERSASSHLSDSRAVTGQYRRASDTSRSESRQRRLEATGSDRSWRPDDTIYGDLGHDDLHVTSSDKLIRNDSNEELDDTLTKTPGENTTEFDTSQDVYDRRFSQLSHRSPTRTGSPPTRKPSPCSKPSREDTQPLTTVQGRVVDKYGKKCGDSYITVTSSNLSTSSKSDCSNFQVTVKSCKDGTRKTRRDGKLSGLNAELDNRKSPRQAATDRHSYDYRDEADVLLPSRKESNYEDYYSAGRHSSRRYLSEADRPISSERGRQNTVPSSVATGRTSSRNFQATALNNEQADDAFTGGQGADEHRRSGGLTGQPMRRSGSALSSGHSVRFPRLCQETSSDTSSLPAIRDDHADSRGRLSEFNQTRKPYRPLPMKRDISEDSPAMRSLSGTRRDTKRSQTGFHIISRPSSRMGTGPRIEVKATSSVSSQDIPSIEHHVQTRIQQGLQSRNTRVFGRAYSPHSSATGASTSDDIKSQNTTSLSPEELDCDFSEDTPGNKVISSKPVTCKCERPRSCCDVKKLRGRITFRCSDCGSGRPHCCKYKDAKVAIQRGKVKVVATPSGGRVISCNKSNEHLSPRKSHMYTSPPARQECPMTRKKCLESFLSDSCMDRYEPDSLNYKTKYGLSSSYCDPLRLPSHRPFTHNLDFLSRRASRYRSRSSFHIPNTRYSPYTSRLYDRPSKYYRKAHGLPPKGVSVGCQSRSNSASPSPISCFEAAEVIDPFGQIVTPQPTTSRQVAQQTHAYQKRMPHFGLVHVDFEKSPTVTTSSSQSRSPEQTNSFYLSSPDSSCSHKEYLESPKFYDKKRQFFSRNHHYIRSATNRALANKTSPSSHPRTVPPPREMIPGLYAGLISRPWSVTGLLRPLCYDQAEELLLRCTDQSPPSSLGHGREAHCMGIDKSVLLPSTRPTHQSLLYSVSNSCFTTGSSDVELWARNINFSSSVGDKKVRRSGSNAAATEEVSPQLIDNLNLCDVDPVWSSLSLDISQSLEVFAGRGETVCGVWTGDNLLQIAQFLPPLPVAGNQTLDMIRRNSEKAVLYARKLLDSVPSVSRVHSECGIQESIEICRSPSHCSRQRIRYVLVKVNSENSEFSSHAVSKSDSLNGQTTNLSVNSCTSDVNVSASASGHQQMLHNEMSAPTDEESPDRASKDEDEASNHFRSVCQCVSPCEGDMGFSHNYQELNQTPVYSLQGCHTPNEDLSERVSSCQCQSIQLHVSGVREAGEAADPCSVTFCRTELSTEEEHTLRRAIDRTLNLFRDFTLIPLCCVESNSSLPGEETDRDAKSIQQGESDTDEQGARTGNTDSSKIHFDTFLCQDGCVYDKNDKKIKVYIISSGRQKRDDTEESMPQLVSRHQSCEESTADALQDICSTVLGSQGCSVEVFGKSYHVFTIDELISVTSMSKFHQRHHENTAEIRTRGQQTRVNGQDNGKHISHISEKDTSVNDLHFGCDFLSADITFKRNDEVDYDVDKSSRDDNFADDRSDEKHLHSQQHLYTIQKPRLVSDNVCAISGHLFDHSLSDDCSDGVAPSMPVFSRNRCENVNNSLASPPTTSQGQEPIHSHVPPPPDQHGWRDDVRYFPTMQQSTWLRGECSRHVTMVSQHLDSVQCDDPLPHGIWNYRQDSSKAAAGGYKSGVNCELSPELDSQTVLGWIPNAMNAGPDVQHNCSIEETPDNRTGGICQQTMTSILTNIVSLVTANRHSQEADKDIPCLPEVVAESPNSHQVDADISHSGELIVGSSCSFESPHTHEERCKVESDNDNTGVTFLSLSSECLSCISRSCKSKTPSENPTDINTTELVNSDATIAKRNPTCVKNPLGLLEVLISGKLKVIFDKALERWVSPSHKRCSQLTRGNRSAESKGRSPPTELHDSLSSPGQVSIKSGQPIEDGLDTSSEFFTTVRESLSERSITEESYVLLSIPADSDSADEERELPETARLNNEGTSEAVTQETTDHSSKKPASREKYVLSVKKKRIVTEKRCQANKDQNVKTTKLSPVSSSIQENVWSEGNMEGIRSDPTNLTPDQTNIQCRINTGPDQQVMKKHESPVWTRSMTSLRSSEWCGSRRQDSEAKDQSLHRSVVSSSRKHSSVSSLRMDQARPRRRHERKASRTSKHVQARGERANREITIEITCSRKKDAASCDEVCKTLESEGLKNEHQSSVGAEACQHTSRVRGKSPVANTRCREMKTSTDMENSKIDSISTIIMDVSKTVKHRHSEPARECTSSMNREMNCCSLASLEPCRRSHLLQGQQLRTAAIHNNMRINNKGDRLAKGIHSEDSTETECLKSAMLTPIKEESLSHDNSIAEKSTSGQESLTRDISDTAASHTNDSYSKSKNSNDSSHSISSHLTSSQHSPSVRYSRHAEVSAASSRQDRIHQRERPCCTRHFKDTDCQTDEPRGDSPDGYEDFLSYLENRCPFKSAFLRQEMRGSDHWSVQSRGSSAARKEDELLRTYAGGGSSSSYFRTGKLDLNAFWYRKMRNINMNWAESDQNQVFVSPQTNLSSMEGPVSATKDSKNWTGHPALGYNSVKSSCKSGELNQANRLLNDNPPVEGTGHTAFSCISMQHCCRLAEKNHMTMLLNDNLIKESNGHLSCHCTSMEPSCSSQKLNNITKILSDNLANKGTGRLDFCCPSTKPGCRSREMNHTTIILSENFPKKDTQNLTFHCTSMKPSCRSAEMNHTAMNFPKKDTGNLAFHCTSMEPGCTSREMNHTAMNFPKKDTGNLAFHCTSMEPGCTSRETNHPNPLLNKHFSKKDTENLAFHCTSMEPGCRSTEINHPNPLMNKNFLKKDIENLAFHCAYKENGCRSKELNHPNVLMKSSIPHDCTTSVNRIATHRHIYSPPSRQLAVDGTDNRPPYSLAVLSGCNKSTNNVNAEFSVRPDELKVNENPQNEGSAKWLTIQIHSVIDLSIPPNDCIHAG